MSTGVKQQFTWPGEPGNTTVGAGLEAVRLETQNSTPVVVGVEESFGIQKDSCHQSDNTGICFRALGEYT
jgi:hypothetical protein